MKSPFIVGTSLARNPLNSTVSWMGEVVKKLVSGLFRIELVSVVSKYYPFSPVEINNILEYTNSIDAVIKLAEAARVGGTDIYTAYSSLVGNPANNKIVAELLTVDGNNGHKQTE